MYEFPIKGYFSDDKGQHAFLTDADAKAAAEYAMKEAKKWVYQNKYINFQKKKTACIAIRLQFRFIDDDIVSQHSRYCLGPCVSH